jgi:hypothetical protein
LPSPSAAERLWNLPNTASSTARLHATRRTWPFPRRAQGKPLLQRLRWLVRLCALYHVCHGRAHHDLRVRSGSPSVCTSTDTLRPLPMPGLSRITIHHRRPLASDSNALDKTAWTALTPFVCVRPPSNKPAPEPVRRHRITHACICKVLATAAAYPKRAHVHKCALNVAIDACLALTRGLEAPCAAEKGGEWLYLDV